MSAVLTPPSSAAVAPALPDPPDGFELVDGQLKELNVSQLSSYTAGMFYLQLQQHVLPRRLGWVFPENTSYRCFPDDPTRVRRADTAFHLLARRTAEQVTEEGHGTVVPDIVVEVVSPHDSADDVNRKRVEWQRAGAAVWVVFPLDQEVHAYYADGRSRVFGPADTLTGEPVLPEFRVPVADFFRLPTP